MASAPSWKVYRFGKSGEYIGACKYAEDAAALAAIVGAAVIKWNHRLIVWTEGAEAFSAAESYDRAADIMHRRLEAERARRRTEAEKRKSVRLGDLINK